MCIATPGSALPVRMLFTTTLPLFCAPGGPANRPTPAPSPVIKPFRAEVLPTTVMW